VGHAQIQRSESATGILESDRLEMQLGNTSRRVVYRVHVETESTVDGALLRMLREVDTSEGHSRIEARVVDGDLEVGRDFGKSSDTTRLAGAARDLKSDESARDWLAAIGRGESRPPLRFRSWDPVKGAVVEVEFSADASNDAGNVLRRVFSERGTTGSLLRVDAHGQVVRELMSLGSYQFERRAATEAEARAPDQAFDHVAQLIQKSPYRIPEGDMDQKIRYRFDNHGNAAALPTGAGQRAWVDGTTTWMQVCASCPLDVGELTAEDRARALAPTPWLESADPRLARRAAELVGQRTDPAQKMKLLAGFVRDHMSDQVDMLGYGTALQAYLSRRGDCTEYATLLAALGRAAGVPTRIAIGRVYAREFESWHDVFVPHAWVQAWTGTGWQNFDAAVGSFDSTHLAFAVNYDGDPATHYSGMKLARELTLEGAARVVPRAAAN